MRPGTARYAAWQRRSEDHAAPGERLALQRRVPFEYEQPLLQYGSNEKKKKMDKRRERERKEKKGKEWDWENENDEYGTRTRTSMIKTRRIILSKCQNQAASCEASQRCSQESLEDATPAGRVW